MQEKEDVQVKKKVLIVDDEHQIRELLRLYFHKEGFETVLAANGQDALNLFGKNDVDIVVLDLMLPDIDGYEVCKRLREKSQVPIIMLTARTEVVDKIVGLDIGADDYIAKPFDANELMARVNAVLRRSQIGQEGQKDQEQAEPERVSYPDLLVDKASYRCEINGKAVDMPPKELELLFFLAVHPNRVYSREQLLTYVWGYDFFGESRTVDVHIKRIREKIEQLGSSMHWSIKTVWGVGYKFELED